MYTIHQGLQTTHHIGSDLPLVHANQLLETPCLKDVLVHGSKCLTMDVRGWIFIRRTRHLWNLQVQCSRWGDEGQGRHHGEELEVVFTVTSYHMCKSFFIFIVKVTFDHL